MEVASERSMHAEIFDLIRGIKDPEHPQTLEDLHVVYAQGVSVHPYGYQPSDATEERPSWVDSDQKFSVLVEFCPTVPHCSLATLIGLCIRVKLESFYPGLLKLDIVIKEGSHNTGAEISKQLNDKERVAAAMENPQMQAMVSECLSYT